MHRSVCMQDGVPPALVSRLAAHGWPGWRPISLESGEVQRWAGRETRILVLLCVVVDSSNTEKQADMCARARLLQTISRLPCWDTPFRVPRSWCRQSGRSCSFMKIVYNSWSPFTSTVHLPSSQLRLPPFVVQLHSLVVRLFVFQTSSSLHSSRRLIGGLIAFGVA